MVQILDPPNIGPSDFDKIYGGVQKADVSWLTKFLQSAETGLSSQKFEQGLGGRDLEHFLKVYQPESFKTSGMSAKAFVDTAESRSIGRAKSKNRALLQPGTKQTLLTTGLNNGS